MNINKKLIEVLKDKTICWYPSAGEDFRPLLYLSEQYVSTRDAIKNISPLPELFVFTDYHNSYFDSNYKGLKALSEGTLRKGDYLFDDSVRGTLHFDYKNTKIKEGILSNECFISIYTWLIWMNNVNTDAFFIW